MLRSFRKFLAGQDVTFGKIGPQGGDNSGIVQGRHRPNPADEVVITLEDTMGYMEVFITTAVTRLIQDENDKVISIGLSQLKSKTEFGAQFCFVDIRRHNIYWLKVRRN